MAELRAIHATATSGLMAGTNQQRLMRGRAITGRPMGRPAKTSGAARTEVLRMRATTAEVDAAYRLARRHDVSVAALLRAGLRRLLRESPVAVVLDS